MSPFFVRLGIVLGLALAGDRLVALDSSYLVGVDFGGFKATGNSDLVTALPYSGPRASAEWRFPLPADDSVTLKAAAAFHWAGNSDNTGWTTYDQEQGTVQGLFNLGPGVLGTDAGNYLSFRGTLSDPAQYDEPWWKVRYAVQDQVFNPFARVSGQYWIEPSTSGDYGWHTLELGVKYDPTLEWNLSVSGLTEAVRYTEIDRTDYSGGAKTLLSLLLGYVARMEISAQSEWWQSTASNSNRLELRGDWSLNMSPHREWNLILASSVQAIVLNPALQSESWCASVHSDWSPDGRYYLYTDVRGTLDFTDSLHPTGGDGGCTVGLEICF